MQMYTECESVAYVTAARFEHKQGVTVNSDFLTANPQLQNKTSLEVSLLPCRYVWHS